MTSGLRLKQIRTRLGVSVREVERLSMQLAAKQENSDYAISNSWLTHIENSRSVPGIHKLYSLSVIYQEPFMDLLKLYGVEADAACQPVLEWPANRTRPVSMRFEQVMQHVSFPVRFDPGFSPERTSLLARFVEIWGEVPAGFLQRLNPKRCQYAYIGLEDRTMYPLIRPGSFVQIDDGRTRIQNSGWRTEFERPIYFVELRGSYACCWCELHDQHLILIPHPESGRCARRVPHPGDAEVLGQVVGVAMRIAPQTSSSGTAALPEPQGP